MTRQRRAFTLLELLVVMAIIAILMTLLTLGVRSMNRSGREKATRTTFENLKNLVAERQKSGGMTAIYALYGNAPPATYGLAIAAPGAVYDGAPARLPNIQTAPPPPQPLNEVGRTRMVMNLLRAVPMNATMMSQMPANSFLTPVPDTPPYNAPIPVDGWGNPMIFVPGGGLSGVYVTGDNGNPVATSITAPDGKGFWASAGPDGSFNYAERSRPANAVFDVADDGAAGDDNVYSFQN